jgi:hypothetical protein
MSAAANTQQQPAVKAANVPNTYWATLVRGDFYSLGEAVWTPGKSLPVPTYIKEHLEKTAVDQVTVEDASEAKQKFKFSPIAAGQPEVELAADKEAAPVARVSRVRTRAS